MIKKQQITKDELLTKLRKQEEKYRDKDINRIALYNQTKQEIIQRIPILVDKVMAAFRTVCSDVIPYHEQIEIVPFCSSWGFPPHTNQIESKRMDINYGGKEISLYLNPSYKYMGSDAQMSIEIGGINIYGNWEETICFYIIDREEEDPEICWVATPSYTDQIFKGVGKETIPFTEDSVASFLYKVLIKD